MRIHHALYSILLSLPLFILSCGGNGERMDMLQQADSLMADRPDSALTLLNALLPDTTRMSKGDLMRFHLLRTNAQNKCDTVFRAEHAALMRRVCDYYDHKASPPWGDERGASRMLAHYLLGRCYDDMGEAPAALQEFHNAADTADTTSMECNYHQLSLIHSQLSHIYNLLYLTENEFDELQEASRYALLAKDTLTCLILKEAMGIALEHLQKVDTSLLVREQCAKEFENMGYGNLSAITLGTTIYALIQSGQTDKAKAYIRLYETKSGLFDKYGNIEKGREVFYYSKGLFYLSVNQLDSAEFFFRKELRYGTTANDQICASQGLCKLYERKHNNDSVAKYAKYSYRLSDSTYVKENAANLQRMQALHNFTRHQQIAVEKEKSLRASKTRARILVIGIMVAFLVLAIIIIRYRKYKWKKEKEINEALLRYIEDKNELIHRKQKIEKLLEVEFAMRQEYEERIAIQDKRMEEMEAERDSLAKRIEDERKSSETEIQILKSVIDEERKEVEELSSRLGEVESRHQHQKNEKSIESILSSELFGTFKIYTVKKKQKPSDKEWEKLQQQIEEAVPDFKPLLRKRRISREEYKVCMLVILGLGPGEILSLLDRDKDYPYLAKMRRRLLKKVYHLEGKPEQFDRLLQEII